MLREHPFARDEPMTGVEVELNLVDSELVPALQGRQVLDVIADNEFQSELGRWNLELNLPPRPLPGDQWRRLEHHLASQLGLARSAADSVGARLAVIGAGGLVGRHVVSDADDLVDDRVVVARTERAGRRRHRRAAVRGRRGACRACSDDPPHVVSCALLRGTW